MKNIIVKYCFAAGKCLQNEGHHALCSNDVYKFMINPFFII